MRGHANPSAMTEDSMATVLAWLHERQAHELRLAAGAMVLAPVLVRGGEPLLRYRDESEESYELKVYAEVTGFRMSPEQLHVLAVHDDLLEFELRGERVTIYDEER